MHEHRLGDDIILSPQAWQLDRLAAQYSGDGARWHRVRFRGEPVTLRVLRP